MCTATGGDCGPKLKASPRYLESECPKCDRGRFGTLVEEVLCKGKQVVLLPKFTQKLGGKIGQSLSKVKLSERILLEAVYQLREESNQFQINCNGAGNENIAS